MTVEPSEEQEAAVRRAADEVRARITAAGGDPERIRIVAVTKGHPASAVVAAVRAGLPDVGESYAQELSAKAAQLDEQADEVRWHAIGRLQRNKVRLLAAHVDLWQSIDRLSLAGEVARHAPGARVLVQVNVTGAQQQGGCPPERTAAVVEGCRDLGLMVVGLMAIGPLGPPAAARHSFEQLGRLADRLALPERSMGMSADLEPAVAAGSTMVRVGSALFGPRPGARPVGK